MAPTPPNLNLTGDGAGSPHHEQEGAFHYYNPPAPAAPAAALGGGSRARSQHHPERDAYGGMYLPAPVPPPGHNRKLPPPVPPYPGTEHLYNYPVVVKDGLVPPLPPGPPGSPMAGGGAAIVVRAEEALLVLLVLVLWVAAIALFFNRWGKIRMLEPYQPKFQQHRQSCALVDISGATQHHRLSKLNLHSLGEPVMLTGPPGPAARAQLLRPRQNSVFVGASPAMLTALNNPPRKVKSAMDLQTLVLSEHEPAMGSMGAASASMLPTLGSTLGTGSTMRRASHVPIGSVPLGALRHHASFSHASFEQQHAPYHRPFGQPSCAPPAAPPPAPPPCVAGPSTSPGSVDRYSHGSNV